MPYSKNPGRHSHRCIKFLAAFFSAALVLTAVPHTAHASGVVLKVGYSDSDGIIVDDNGVHSGYAVEYLEEIAKYTGWEYEFVFDTWTNGLGKLERGELDLMVMAHHTPERDEKLLFSHLSMAHDYTALYASTGSDIYFQDYAAFENCRVAVVEGTVYADDFAAYALENGLDCEIIRFGTEQAAKEAMLKGRVELLATSGFSYNPDMKLVDRFELDRCFIVTGKQNTALMDELNEAVEKARLHNQDLEGDLLQTCYGANSPVTGLYLTREEQAYVESVGPIVVKGFDGRRPMGYITEDGRFVGILPDYLDMLGAFCVLEFVYEAAEVTSLAESAARMKEDGYVLLSTDQTITDISPAVYKSEDLFQTALAYVRRQGEYVTKADPHTFAINKALGYVGEMLLETNAQSTVLYYDSSMECMEAVLNGKAEMTILDEHVAAYLLQKPKFADHLTQVAGSTLYVDGMCLYAPEEHRHLVSILDKTLEYVPSAQRVNVVSNAMMDHAYTYQLEDIVYVHRNTLLISIGFLAVILALVAVLSVRAAALKKREKENQALQEQIQLDELSGVYNRTSFFSKAREMIDRCKDDVCIVRLNVCHFKVVNELYGPEKGDRLLREMGQGLMELSRQKNFLAGRFTADHFYLCIRQKDFESIDFARRSPAPWLGMDINTTYGVYPVEDPKDIPISAMCDRADMAIQSNRQSATDHIFYYSDDARQQLLREQEIENEMEQAVAQRQFCIYIQPKYDIETERIVGGEVLVRWKHPQKGMIPPGDFISLFERNGFILNLDYYVWEECCRFLSETKRKGLPVYPLSVNVSRIHFYGTELQNKLMELLERYSLDAGELELEITESLYAEEPDVIVAVCTELRKAGFKIAMDDFGSGYSSLNMLKEMPLDIIKMDLRFLSGEADAERVEKGHSILRTLIELAHTLELQVVVEGLETETQRDFIRTIGRCSAQGYYYSRPIDCGSYEALLDEKRG